MADAFAKQGLVLVDCCYVFENIPLFASNAFQADCNGVFFPRGF